MMKYLLRLVVSVSMLFFCHSGVVVAGVSNDLEIIRQRVIADLLNEKEVERHFIDKFVETLKPDGSWPDINTTADLPVFTTVNQTLLNGAVNTRDAKGQRAIDTGRHLLSSTTWIHHDSVGYFFPSPTPISVSAGIQKGNWRKINHQAWATTEEVSENIFSAWFDHGPKVKDASYQYIVLPAVAVKQLETYSKKNDIVILSNSADLQAVQHKGLNLTQAVFYKPGGLQIAKDIFIKVDQPCILMLHSGNGIIDRIHLAEPTHKLQTIQLTAADKSKKEKSMVVQLGTGGDAGKTVRVL